ncbi:hypothetical protein [Deinococcus yavapaiensis]|uniref:YtkA-like protein n=1 Tax=Deinococcus yavapaiensis KR-236 TaxID=694435 RepID=A0A318SD71_9DEIO|nr:hypothetical protein [Deinococcus yavapaiensis]PYE54831.1 hypothetical protein DES52_104102 [Deinococcus yavapaiensis KR-236]
MNHLGKILLATLALASTALAHTTKTVGTGTNQYKVIVGSRVEPATTMQLNGLDLIIRTMNDQPVENLQNSLKAEITTLDGKFKRELTIRAQFGKPGYYTDDYVFSQPGQYKIRVYGYIGTTSFDETYETHDVLKLEDLMFPPVTGR